MTKIDKFKPSKEKKAYSYFGTICKNYLMGQIQKDQKEINRKISYEDISSDLDGLPSMVYYIDNDDVTTEQVIVKFLDELKIILDDDTMLEEERKLGDALYDIFSNYTSIFQETTNNNKFNKNIILFELREMTNLLMQEIYNELVEKRNTAIRIQNKMLTMMKEPEDMTLIGPVIEKQQKIINDCVEKKLSLSKLQTQIWQKSSMKEEDNFTLSDLDLDDEIMKSLIDKDTSTNYKLNK
jgi:hypothetical protein